MFVKSCNCNSSIATRVGFAVGSLVVRRPADRPLTLRVAFVDHLLSQLDFGMDYENRHDGEETGGMDPWLSVDGLCRREVLWRSCGECGSNGMALDLMLYHWLGIGPPHLFCACSPAHYPVNPSHRRQGYE